MNNNLSSSSFVARYGGQLYRWHCILEMSITTVCLNHKNLHLEFVPASKFHNGTLVFTFFYDFHWCPYSCDDRTTQKDAE